jgi:hypothetical protein
MSPRKRKLLSSTAPLPQQDEKKTRPRMAYRNWSANRKPGDAHTIKSFCEANAISETKFFNLKRDGKGPREIDLDGRILITPEAEADWRRAMEAETAAKRQAEAESAAKKPKAKAAKRPKAKAAAKQQAEAAA